MNIKLSKPSLIVLLLLCWLPAFAQLNPSALSKKLMTNNTTAGWQADLGISGNATNAIASTNGTGVGTTLVSPTITGSSSIGSNGTTTIYNATGDGSGFTNLHSQTYALFGLGMIPRRYEPAGSYVANWGAAPVITLNGQNWIGAKGFPSLTDPNYSWRDCSIHRNGNTIFAAVTADANGLNSRSVSFVNIYSSTNFFSTFSFVTAAYFTNAASFYAAPDQTYAPEFFVDHGYPCLIASCFFDDTNVAHVFRVIRATDTNGLSTWSTATNVDMTGIDSGANDPFIWNTGTNFYLWAAASSLTLFKSSSPLGTWTNVVNETFNGQVCEGPSMVRLPNGTYRLYTDQYFKGQMIYAESSSIESGWTVAGTNQDEYYWGHFTPIVLTSLEDIVAAHQAASTSSRQAWNPQAISVTWSTTNDEAFWGFGPYSFISGTTTNASVSYQNGIGAFLNTQKKPHQFGVFEDGWTRVGGNGLIVTNILSVSNPTNTAPGTPGSVNQWMKITNNGVGFWSPLYQ